MNFGNFTIRTNFDYPPIPDRSNDWSAWCDGLEEWKVGRGETELDALVSLRNQLIEDGVIACHLYVERKEPAQPPLPTLAEVRSVIEPFAKYAELLTDDAEYTRIGYYESSPRVRDCRAAADLLSRIPEGE